MAELNIARRLDFMALDAKTTQSLRGLRPLLMEEAPAALDRFYAQVRRFPETSHFFTSESQIQAAQRAQQNHWGVIAGGEYDEGYAAAVSRIGGVHARIGLEPRWYIGGYALVLEHLVRAVVRRRWPKGFGKGDGGAEVGDQLVAIIKATLLDMDLVMDVYFTAAETARAQAEAQRQAMETEQAMVVAALAEALARLARGDLTTRILERFAGDNAKLGEDFNGSVETLERAMAAVIAATSDMTGTLDELTAASDDLSRRTEQQAATLEETAAAVEEITTTVNKTAEGALQTAAAVSSARSEAEGGGAVVAQAIAAMDGIKASSSEISQIIGVIDEIAFQTNLLALNAGVEAARAGEAGRGFAVVAQEVRALAQRAADAAKQIKGLISVSSVEVQKGVDLVGQTGEALQKIVGRVAEIDGRVREIAASAQEQSSALAEINSAVTSMDRTTQQNAAMVEESAAASAALASNGADLRELMAGFRVGGGGGRRRSAA